MADSTANLSIGQVAERTGLSVHALRFYEREGVLVAPVRRDPGGRRVYGEDDVEWLNLCIILRASGMPLPEIRKYAELVRDGAGNEEQRLALFRDHQQRVTEQIARMHRCLDLISHKVRVYEDIVADAATPCEPGTETAPAPPNGAAP